MVLTDDSDPCISGQDSRYAFHYDSRMRKLLTLMPGAMDRSGIEVTPDEVLVGMHPGGDVRIPRDSITRVWRTRAGDQGVLFWLAPVLGVHSNLRGLWWMNGSVDNLVAIDIDPPATGRVWGIPIKPRRVVVSLETPERFIDEVLG